MCRCEDMKMWRWEDVMWRWEDVMWRWDYVKVWRCADVQMWGYEDVKMWRWEDVMWRWEDVKVRRCADVRIWRCEDEKMRRCDVKMRRCEGVKMCRCADVRVWRCEDAKMWWTCKHMKMYSRPRLLEEPFTQTLSGKKLSLSSLTLVCQRVNPPFSQRPGNGENDEHQAAWCWWHHAGIHRLITVAIR